MKVIYGAALSATLAVANVALANLAHAGWGAIAYNPNNGASSETHDYAALPDALNAAMQACGSGCLIVTWEHDECIAFATDANGVWGSFSNAANKAAAIQGAIAACGGSGCSVQQWACG